MARHVDYEALIARLEVTDVFMAIQDDEPVILAVCIECDAVILRAVGAEVNAAELHLAVLGHDCDEPAEPVVVDYMAEIDEALDATEITTAEPPAPAAVPETVVPQTARVLQLADRCDRCGVQAFVRTEAKAGPLLFCGHHWNEVALTITAAGYPVVDERHLINARPSVSATAE